MSDDVQITSGAGTTVATDEVGGRHFQKTKIDLGGDGVSVAPSVGAGASDTGTQRVVVATDQAGIDVAGGVAHGASDSGDPVKIGAIALSSDPAIVDTADRVNVLADLIGRLVTMPFSLPQNILDPTPASATGTADTQVFAAQGAGVRIYVTAIYIVNTSANNTFVNIKDGSTTKLVLPAPASSGAIVPLPSPLRLTANAALNFASGLASTTIYVSAVGYKGA